MRVWQPGSTLVEQRQPKVDDWSWAATKRRLTALYRLARPYRRRRAARDRLAARRDGRVARPPILIGAAVDTITSRRHRQPRPGSWSRSSRSASSASPAPTRRPTSPAGSGERMLADLRNHLFRHLQRLSLGFYERNRAGVLISRLTNDVEALDQLVTDGVTSLIQNTLTLIGAAVILFVLSWKLALATLTVIPALIVATAIFRKKSGRSYRARPRDARRRSRRRSPRTSPACASCRRSRASAAARENFRRVGEAYRQRNQRDGRPERRLLPVRRPALVARDRDHPRLRRLPRLRRADDDRRPDGVPRLRDDLLRPGAAALAALQHVPLRRRGARQDHGGARRGAAGDRRAGRRARSTGIRGHVRFDGRPLLLRHRPGGAARHRPRRPAGHDRRARRPHRRRQVDDREADRPLLRPDRRGRSPSTASTSASVTQESLRLQLGIVPQEGFLFAGTVADNIAFGRPGVDPRGDRRRRPGRRRRRVHRAARGGLRHRARRARLPPLARPAPAGRLRARAPRRPAHPHPRRGDELGRHRAPSAASSTRCAACSTAAPPS